jgi:hypothetical protein
MNDLVLLEEEIIDTEIWPDEEVSNPMCIAYPNIKVIIDETF